MNINIKPNNRTIDFKRIMINEMETDDVCNNYYVLANISKSLTKNGKEYVKLSILDSTGTISGNIWDVPANYDKLKESAFVRASFVVSEYNDMKQASFKEVEPAKDTDIPDIGKLIPVSPEKAEDLWKEVNNTIDSFSNKDIQFVTRKVFDDNMEELKKYPGGQMVHHAVLGGLLLHLTGLLRVAKALASVYGDINTDLLYAGTVLHDIGKIEEFKLNSLGLVDDYSATGQLMGHVYIGAKYIGDICEANGIDPEISMCLQHMILSHHGKPEWGSPVYPMFKEAYLLHICDLVDSRMYIFHDVEKNLEPGEFSDKVFFLDNVRVYKPKF